ncbi:response regulator transcription factor [Flammeovirgaceae bacterium SG7u.111]|nr:response regulator transcription factor [Flammeovirgaceae bacterium SG7u.132]WPO33309.1 response regulator transcription factor [Flammeovirgaceae bacterium SG7u.111]
MRYKCLIVDDEELARELIETHLSHLEDFELVASCGNAIDALKILQNEQIDLIFLDIEMPVLKGTDFLKSLSNPPKVVFTTAFRNYAVEGFELSAVDYLLKPIIFERFIAAIEKFREGAKKTMAEGKEKKEHVFVQSNKKNIKIKLDEILYVESLKDYIKIHFASDELMFKCSLTSFEELLDNHFLRVHRSFIVNIDKVTAFTKHDIEIGSNEIPIGESYKIFVLDKFG